MSGIRRFFWNVNESFMGKKLLAYAPIQASILPIAIILPAYLLINGIKGKTPFPSIFSLF
jgi:hypothetical protein